MGERLLKVEKLGGFAGFGTSSHLRSEAEIDLDSLPEKVREKIERLLKRVKEEQPAAPGADTFRYVLSWLEGGHHRTVEVMEHELPEVVRSAVKDKLV